MRPACPENRIRNAPLHGGLADRGCRRQRSPHLLEQSCCAAKMSLPPAPVARQGCPRSHIQMILFQRAHEAISDDGPCRIDIELSRNSSRQLRAGLPLWNMCISVYEYSTVPPESWSPSEGTDRGRHTDSPRLQHSRRRGGTPGRPVV